MDLFVHTGRQHDTTVVHLAGAVTGETAGVLEHALVEVFAPGTSRIVVELSGVTRCDDLGVAVLAGAAAVAVDRGGEIRLAAPPPCVYAWLRAENLMAQVATFVSVPGAVRAELVELVCAPDRHPQSWTATAAHAALAATRASARHGQGRTGANRRPFRHRY